MLSTLTTNKTKDPTITTKILKYIILECYKPEDGYSLQILTNNAHKVITGFLNRKNKIDYRYNGKTKFLRVDKLNCWDCGLEIFVNNLIVLKPKSNIKRRYHFRCALKKQLVIQQKEMHEDYRKFMLGILI